MTCPSCGAKWSWTGRAWLISDVHGRLHPPLTSPLSDGQPEPLTRCPVCQVRVVVAKAAVTEKRA